MNDLNTEVFKNYNCRIKRIVREKSGYICNTDRGIKTLKKSFDSPEHIFFQHEIKEFLFSEGFIFIDRFDVSLSGSPFFSFGDEIYTLGDALSFGGCDFTSTAQFKMAVEMLSIFHKKAKGLSFKGEKFSDPCNFSESYSKDLAELINIKKRISGQKGFSDFDVIFLKNFGFYVDKLESSLQLLKDTPILKNVAYAHEKATVCHGFIREDSVLLDNSDVYLTNFSRASIGLQLVDLAGLIKRYIKVLPKECLDIRDILEIYAGNNPLSSEDVKILFAILSCPQKFLKICGQYYSKKRTWTPSAIGNRIDASVFQKDLYYAFIDPLKNI